MKSAKSVLGIVFIGLAWGFLWLCCSNIINPPPEPYFLIHNTNKTNPDTASFKNCAWSGSNKSIFPLERSQPFAFGYLFKEKYYVITVDSTQRPDFDDSAAFWGGINEDGKPWSYFPFDVKPTQTPVTARFLRAVRHEKRGREPKLRLLK